jgi:hypothetical protein
VPLILILTGNLWDLTPVVPVLIIVSTSSTLGLDLYFRPEDGGSMFLRNISISTILHGVTVIFFCHCVHMLKLSFKYHPLFSVYLKRKETLMNTLIGDVLIRAL